MKYCQTYLTIFAVPRPWLMVVWESQTLWPWISSPMKCAGLTLVASRMASNPKLVKYFTKLFTFLNFYLQRLHRSQRREKEDSNRAGRGSDSLRDHHHGDQHPLDGLGEADGPPGGQDDGDQTGLRALRSLPPGAALRPGQHPCRVSRPEQHLPGGALWAGQALSAGRPGKSLLCPLTSY